MYFLIGIWGGPRREYARSSSSSHAARLVLMLVTILYLYFASEPHSFDMTRLGELVGGRIPLNVQPSCGGALHRLRDQRSPPSRSTTWLPDAHVEAPTAIFGDTRPASF